MRAYLVTTFVGIIVVDDNRKIILIRPFPKDPYIAAEKFQSSQQDIIQEEKEVLEQLKKENYDAEKIDAKNPISEYIKNNLRKISIEQKIFRDEVEFNQFFSKFSIELARIKIKKSISRDAIVSQVNGAIEEVDKSINIFVERIREWYGLHFPEMDRLISNHEKFVKLIVKFGSREKIEDTDLEYFKEKSMGMDFNMEDIKIVQEFANQILELYKLRESLVKYLEKILREIAPNFTELAGPILAAKFISRAGGLEKLAKMASSTIQLLGAEKALFRHLRGKGKSPRFGILFSHPLIQNSPEKLKGKIARVLASKLYIATKIDFYSKKYVAESLKKDLEKRVKEIQKSK